MGGARHGKGFGCYKEVFQGCSYESCEHELQGGRSGKSNRKERASSWRGRWKLYTTLVFLFASLCVFPSDALAYVDYNEMGISWGPNVVDNPAGEYGVIVVTDNIYNCALITLGYSPLDTRLTHDVMAKLSNSSTGGAFYTFSQLVQKYYDGTFHYPRWGNWGTFDVQANVYGKEYIYWVQYTNAQAASAKEDLEAILNGGNLGGGGGGGSGDDGGIDVAAGEHTYELVPVVGVFNKLHHGAAGWQADALPVENCRVTANIKTVSDKRNVKMYGLCVDKPSTPWDWQEYDLLVFYSDSDYDVSFALGSNTFTVTPNGSTVCFSFTKSRGFYSDSSDTSTKLYFPKSGYHLIDSLYSQITTTTTYNYQSLNGASVNLALSGYFSSSGMAPSVPDTNWPESDPVDAPQPPELPEPSDPVVEDEPSSTYPVYVDVSTTNYTVDLQGILDAMDDHCIHLQNAIWWGFNELWNKLYQRIDWSVGVVRDEFSATRDYLHDLFGWLAEQFDYSVSGGAYNDSTVVSWLKKIYSNMGLGVNTRPNDPVADPIGIGNWLGQLFSSFIAWLTGFGAGVVSGLAGDFAQLTHKFPFCIPWDIAAMLTLLVADPQAPCFDYPMFTLDAHGSLVQVATLEVDLSDFDVYMGGIRFMQKLLFCFYLAKLTPTLKEMVRVKSVYERG